jgi:hypothetical protein
MRVLHLLDNSSDWPAMHAVATLAQAAPGVHDAVAFGGSATARLAKGLGLTVDRAPGAGTASPLRRLLEHRPKPDLIHAWSVGGALLAADVRPDVPALMWLWQRPHALGWFARRAAGRAFSHCGRVVTASESLTAEYASALRQPIEAAPIALPVNAARIDLSARERIRAEWMVTPDTTVITLIAEPAPSVDARMVGYQAGVLSIAGRRTAAITPSRARDVERARRFRGRHRDREWEIVVEDRPLWKWLPGCDVCVWIEDGALRTQLPLKRTPPACQGLMWAAAAGIPIVAENHPMPREMLGPDGAAYVAPGERLDLNRGLLRVIDDRAWRESRIAAARQAAQRFTAAAFADSAAAIYSELVR